MGRKGKDEVFGGGLPGRGVDKMRKKLKDKMATKENELDSYNKMVDKIGMGIQGAMRSADLGRILGAAPAAFSKRNKKPVFKTGTKETVKGLTQDRAGGGEVFDMTTEMEVNE